MQVIRLTSCAPPLTDEMLETYTELAATASPAKVKLVLEKLLNLVTAWYYLPESGGDPCEHGSGLCEYIPLDENIKTELSQYLPFKEELSMFAEVLEGQTGNIRNAGFHLLWYATELFLDREPITMDRYIR